jgi:hypothetical protein
VKYEEIIRSFSAKYTQIIQEVHNLSFGKYACHRSGGNNKNHPARNTHVDA